MSAGRSSKSCLKLRVTLEITCKDERLAKALYSSLKPDDEPVEGLEYCSRLEGAKISYVFTSSHVLKLRNAVDDVVEKASLAEKALSDAKSS